MKRDCEIFKYVYKRVDFRGGYWRLNKLTNDLTSLSSDFPAAAHVSQCYNTFTLKYYLLNDEVTIWKDKHGNIIVRLLRTNNKQTKLKFTLYIS